MTCMNVFSSDLKSRAVDDDEDYSEDEEGKEDIDIASGLPILRWSAIAGDVKCLNIIIAIGPTATGFVQVYLLECQKTEIIGVLCSGLNDSDVNTLGQRAPTDKTCYVHRILSHPDVLIVQCQSDVQPEQSFAWTEQLLGKTCSSESVVTVLNSSNVNDFKSSIPPGDLPRTFLRALKSGKFKDKLACTYLEQPNMVAGLPAQIMTYCEVHGIPCALYICYIDASSLDLKSMKSFCKVLQNHPFSDIFVENPKAPEQLSKLISVHSTNQNSLYT